ncbi:MAG: hypothetical protein GY765_13715 [bacterium]|nr:hypothetical protein [bacterium]
MNSYSDNHPYDVLYEFKFKDGKRKCFKVTIDPKTMTNSATDPEVKPAWTRLEYQQCEHCPLDNSTVPYCPVALNIVELVEEFKDMLSSDNCIVNCTTPERTYMKETSLQEGLCSIFGLINATSKCPIMGVFRSMARFHLPFSTFQESIARSTSLYLLSQYFQKKKGKIPDLDLKKLEEQFWKVQEVDECILARIENVANKDADRNAYVILNSLVQVLSMEIDEQLNAIEYLFDFQL